MRQALLGALCLLTAGCGAYAFPGGGSSPTPDTGMVSGRVLAVPCSPVEKVNSPCAGRPVAALELDYLVGTKVEGRTVTDASGNYSIRLAPGSYTVRFKNVMRVISGPTKVTVAAGSSVVANYLLDSGIRVPAPQS
jgi:hypothetical protein